MKISQSLPLYCCTQLPYGKQGNINIHVSNAASMTVLTMPKCSECERRVTILLTRIVNLRQIHSFHRQPIRDGRNHSMQPCGSPYYLAPLSIQEMQTLNTLQKEIINECQYSPQVPIHLLQAENKKICQAKILFI